MDKQKIIDKIKKCMALGNSSNANEAAAALRQAQKMMNIVDKNINFAKRIHPVLNGTLDALEIGHVTRNDFRVF